MQYSQHCNAGAALRRHGALLSGVCLALLSSRPATAQVDSSTAGRDRSVAEQPPSGWTDKSAHQTRFFMSGGVRLHYLDWGGRGPLMLWLPGFRSSAHIFDDIAPRFTSHSRVVALSPRGQGESAAPPSAPYTLNALVSDALALLDTLGETRAVLIGHSLAGAAITRFAVQHPERVIAIVYLDAVGQRMGFDSIAARQPVRRPQPDAALLKSPGGLRAYAASTTYGRWSAAAEADFQARPVGEERAQRETLLAPLLAEFTRSLPAYTTVKAPVLAICVVSGLAADFNWAADSTKAQIAPYLRDVLQPFQRRGCQRLRQEAPQAQIHELQSWHYVFLAEPDRVEQLVREFLSRSVLKQ